jgi:hypothetical protein
MPQSCLIKLSKSDSESRSSTAAAEMPSSPGSIPRSLRTPTINYDLGPDGHDPASFKVEGTGFLVGRERYFITAAHVLQRQKALSGQLTRNDRRLIRTHAKPYTLCRAAAAALFQMSFRSEITISLTPRAIEPPNAVHTARRCAITGPGALASESRKTMYPVMKLEYSA